MRRSLITIGASASLEPTEACGPLGCTPIIYPAGESYADTFVDSNNPVLRLASCVEGTGLVCTFSYVRIV